MAQMLNDIDDIQRLILVKLSSANREVVEFDAIQREISAAPALISEALRSLLETRRISLRRGNGSDNTVYLSLANDLTESVSLVMDAVRASGRSGIDQAQIISQTRLGKSEVMKALHTLIENKHIQERRSFTNRAKRIYLLYHLEPSSQVTGGTFYCGEELDVAFVDELRRRIVAFVREQEHAFELRVKNKTRSMECTNFFHFENNSYCHGNEQTNTDSIIGDRSNGEWNVKWCGVTFDDLVTFVKSQCGNNTSRSSVNNSNNNNNNSSSRVSSPVTVITSQHYDRNQGSESVSKQEPPSPSVDFPIHPLNTTHMSNRATEDAFSHNNSVSDKLSTLEQQTFPYKQITERDVMRLLNVLVLDGVLQEKIHVAENYSDQMNDVMGVREGQERKRTRVMDHDSEFNFNDNNDVSFNYEYNYSNLHNYNHHKVNQTSNANVHNSNRNNNAGRTSTFLSYTLASQAHNVMRHFTTQRKSCNAHNYNTTTNTNRAHIAENKTTNSFSEQECKKEYKWNGGKDDVLTVMEILKRGSDWTPAFISTSQNNMAHEFMPAVGFPCIGCPLLASCMVNGKGIVNPYSCVYLHE